MFLWDKIIVPLSLILLALVIFFLIVLVFSMIWSTIQTFVDQRRVANLAIKEFKQSIKEEFKKSKKR